MPNDPLVDIAALPSLASIRYLDARDRAAFDAAHAPGAVGPLTTRTWIGR